MTNSVLIFQKPKNEEELRCCALFQRKLFELLVKENGLMWDEILFPCADSRSVIVAQSLNEPSVFGTHAIISNISEAALKAAADSAAEKTECALPWKIKKLGSEPDSIKKALKAPAMGFEEMLICGDFSAIAAGSDENWKIRDTARKLLSFAETASDKTGKSLVGLLGGRAVFKTSEENASKISKIYESKTGAKMKIHKVRGLAK